ncbi:uncharacterized protein LOC122306247 [Carya illinoinensis]|uniref:uncharacterized protein LOC122306247 n=1 Tax=Carya illinoinensis TaxID=32201 RepID=UPI001C727A72|nr:uncharacterized protein LOC122306247 [Carya illinoinensis]
MDGVIATYSVDDEVKAEDFIKEVTYTVLFNEAECEAKCLCGLFEMQGIICRHILAIFLARKRLETVRYKRLLKICYEVITNACTEDGHTEDMVSKLYAMNEVYCTSKPHNIDSSVGVSTVNAATEGSSKKMLSPHVVRGKGRPPCKRRMSTMEEQIRKKKTKVVRKKGDKGKSRLRHRLDIELLESSRNPLCGHKENAQTPVMVDQESVQQEMMGTQESMQLEMDGT